MEVLGLLLFGGVGMGLLMFAAQHTRKKRNAAWQANAESLGLHFEAAAGWTGRPRMWGTMRGVPVSVDIRVYGSGKNQQTYTRAEADLPSDAPVDLAVSGEGFFSGVGKFFGAQDIQVGIPRVDDAFLIKGSDEAEVTEMLSHEALFQPLKTLCSGRGGIAGGVAWIESYGFVDSGPKLELMLNQVLDVAVTSEAALGGRRQLTQETRPPAPVEETPAPEPVVDDPLQKLADRMLLRREREEVLAQLTEPRVLTVQVMGTETPRDAEGLALLGKVGEVPVEVRYPPDRVDELQGVTKGDTLGVMARCTGWEDFRRRAVFTVH